MLRNSSLGSDPFLAECILYMYILFDFRELQRLLTYIIFGNVLSSVPIPDSQNFRAKIIIVKYSKHLQKFEIFEVDEHFKTNTLCYKGAYKSYSSLSHWFKRITDSENMILASHALFTLRYRHAILKRIQNPNPL